LSEADNYGRFSGNSRQKIIKTASLFMEHDLKKSANPWQIDIVAVLLDSIGKTAKIKHFKNIAKDWQ